MFTGLIEQVGRLIARRPTLLAADIGPLVEGARTGDSVAVNGVCLTVTRLQGTQAWFDVSEETLSRTTLGGLADGAALNLERALPVGGRLGGHLVAGHVDGVGRLLDRRRLAGSEVFTFVLPDGGAVKVVEKGSVAIDGISLTSYDCRGARFSVAVIPTTLERTTLGGLRPGNPVNLEQDQIGRWVAALMAPADHRRQPAEGG